MSKIEPKTDSKFSLSKEQAETFMFSFQEISDIAKVNKDKVFKMSAMNVAWAANRLMNLAADLQDKASNIVEDIKFKEKIEVAKEATSSNESAS